MNLPISAHLLSQTAGPPDPAASKPRHLNVAQKARKSYEQFVSREKSEGGGGGGVRNGEQGGGDGLGSEQLAGSSGLR